MESQGFSRSQRLLTSRDFKLTFDQAKIRFSTPVLLVLVSEQNAKGRQGLPQPSSPDIADNEVEKLLMINSRVHNGESVTTPARLGLVVAKKHLKRAIDRNRFKRLVRESFRSHQLQLAGLDVVVLARNGALRSIRDRASDAESISELLDKAWRYIERKRR